MRTSVLWLVIPNVLLFAVCAAAELSWIPRSPDDAHDIVELRAAVSAIDRNIEIYVAESPLRDGRTDVNAWPDTVDFENMVFLLGRLLESPELDLKTSVLVTDTFCRMTPIDSRVEEHAKQLIENTQLFLFSMHGNDSEVKAAQHILAKSMTILARQPTEKARSVLLKCGKLDSWKKRLASEGDATTDAASSPIASRLEGLVLVTLSVVAKEIEDADASELLAQLSEVYSGAGKDEHVIADRINELLTAPSKSQTTDTGSTTDDVDKTLE